MFQRQTREPFPARNIFLLAALVLAGLLYLLNNIQKTAEGPPPADTEMRAPGPDSLR
jgi:hypothetical protein